MRALKIDLTILSIMGRTLLHTAHMPHNLWVEAFCTAISLINRLPTPILQGTSPYKLLFGVSPDYTFLRVFGCICYPYLGDYKIKNYNLVLFSVFLLATVIAIMVTAASILLQVGSMFLAMSFFMKTNSIMLLFLSMFSSQILL